MTYAKYTKKDVANLLNKDLYYSQNHYSEEEVKKMYQSLLGRMLGKQRDWIKNRTATQRLEELDSWIRGWLSKSDFFDNE
jgi:uncharacterized membrane-anchored protein